MDEKTKMLLEAAKEGNDAGVLRALELGADVNAMRPLTSLTALLLALEWNHLATARLLVQRGANIDRVNSNGWTVLHFISSCGTAAAIKAILALGANVNCRTDEGFTALMHAVENNDSEVVALLIEAGADVKLRGRDGTALDISRTLLENDEVVSLLTEAGRRQEATMLLNWMLAMAPLHLPICEY